MLESEWGDVLHCRWNLFLQTKMENQTISSQSDNCEERGTSPGVKCEIFFEKKNLKKKKSLRKNLVRKGRPGAKCENIFEKKNLKEKKSLRNKSCEERESLPVAKCEGRLRLCSQNMVGNVHCLQPNNNTDAKIEWTCLV